METNIFSKYQTNKKSDYKGIYEESFESVKNDIKLVFEIGVHLGGSLRGFRDYFVNALIVGIDSNPKFFFLDERINVEIGDATKKETIDMLISKYGHPDIVIDDGSHMSKDIKSSYNLLYPVTNICYVIEDYGTQLKGYSNGEFINDGVSALNIAYDKINELMAGRTLKSIRFYHSICLIFK